MIDAFDDVVQTMMDSFGTVAHLDVAVEEVWDEDTSTNIVKRVDYKVKVCVFDYLDKRAGASSEGGTLVQTGDKQVFIQPPHKMQVGIPFPHILPNRDRLKLAGRTYQIVALKEYNPSMTRAGCVLYEAFVRE